MRQCPGSFSSQRLGPTSHYRSGYLPTGSGSRGGCTTCGGPVTVRLIDVGGTQIGINRLDQILRSVKAMGLQDPTLVKRELLRQTKLVNYVPPGVDEPYAEALWREYVKLR